MMHHGARTLPGNYLLFASLILLIFFAPLAPARAALSPQEGVAAAEAMVQKGQYRAAYEMFMELLREYPDNMPINIGAARTSKMAGKFNHARMMYERLVESLPDNAVLRLEYSHLLLAMGWTEQARQELDAAKRIDPTISEGKAAEAIKLMESHTQTVDYKLRLAGGLLYDSNMTTGPSLRGVEIGGLPITLDRTSSERESMGSYVHAAGELAWRARADSPWWIVGDVTGYQRWYERTSPRRDLTFMRAAAGLRYLSGNLLAEARLKTDMLLENNDKSVNLYGIESTVVYAFLPNMHFLARAGLEHREDINTRGRSGTYAWGGPYLRYYFGESRHSLLGGVKAYHSATAQRRFGYRGFEPTLSLMLNLPLDTELIFTGAWHNEDYRGGATILDGQKRKDSQWRGSVYAIKKLTENLRLELGYQYTDNQSNSDLYNYDQHLVTVGLSLNF